MIQKYILIDSKIHSDKFFESVLDFLVSQRLAKKNERGTQYLLVENKTALLYISLLAKYLARVDDQYTVPGTDRRDYEQLIFDAYSNDNAYPCLDIRLINTLPIPRDDVPFKDILEFKQKRRQELLNFRAELDSFQEKISSAGSEEEKKYITIKFGEFLEKELHDLNSLFQSDGLSIVTGCLKIITESAKSMPAVGVAAVLSNQSTKIMDIPVNWIKEGFIALTAIHMANTYVDIRNQKRNSPCSYLYHAQEKGLTLKP